MNPRQPSESVLRRLHAGWSNEGWSGDTKYLEAVWREALRARRVLECGSGLSTIIMGKIARETNAEIWSLEHIPAWKDKVNGVLSRLGLPNRVVDAPMKSYGAFDWYTLPANLPHDFDLVICDGPPSATKGGRYGLVPVCADRIANSKILLDDAERPEEQAVMLRWEKEFGFSGPVQTTSDQAYAELTKTVISNS
jgi:hypothetical protein